MRFTSIRIRFILGLAVVVCGIMVIFSAAAIRYNSKKLESDLQLHLNTLVELTAGSLSSALWQYNHDYVEQYVDSLFLYEDLVYAHVESENTLLKKRFRSGYDEEILAGLTKSDKMLARQSDIVHNGVAVGSVYLVFSRLRVEEEIFRYGLFATLLLILLLSGIVLTVYLLSKIYIFRPLSRLDQSAKEIANGNFAAQIYAGAEDEIGRLAKTFREMAAKLNATMISRDKLEREIAERTRAEKDLQVLYETMELAQKMAGIGYWSHDRILGQRTWSRHMYSLFHLEPKAGPPFEDELKEIIHPKDWPKYKQCFAQAFQGVPYQLTMRIMTADGGTRYIKTEGYPRFDDNGMVTAIFGISLDITEQLLAERALRESEERYRNIFENAVEGIFQSTPEGGFEEVNAAFARMLGYDSPEEVVTAISDIAADYYHDPEDRRKYQEALQQNGFVDDMEYRVRRKDGSVIWITNSTRAYFDENGRVTHYEGVVNDITARKQAEEEREQLQNQLIQSRKMESIGTLAGGIAHDFNNILASVIGFTELALDDVAENSEVAENLDEVVKAGKRARDLVLQILTFARKSETTPQPVHVKTVAEEALRFLRSTIPSTIEIESHLHSNAHILADKTQIYQLFLNICSNSAQAMEDEGGVIGVVLEDLRPEKLSPSASEAGFAGSSLVISISDTGPGIAEEHLDSIFEPYYTTKGVGEGTGLGLAVVHGIVTAYGGEITVSSETGKGTTFTIAFPVCHATPPDSEKNSEPLPTGSEHILFVDDEPAIVKMNERLLTGLGYTVEGVTSSTEALQRFREKPYRFDLVITDMTMPKMNGDRLAAELLKIRDDIPIILCTGFSRRMNREKATAMGIRAFMAKPLSKERLARRIRKVLDYGR